MFQEPRLTVSVPVGPRWVRSAPAEIFPEAVALESSGADDGGISVHYMMKNKMRVT